jgi:hypothetical protein
MIAQIVQNINSWSPGGWGRALPYGVRLVINPFDKLRTSVGSKGRKASAPSQTESHVEQVAMDTESEVAYVRAVMENLPTLARRPASGRRQAPKRGRS